MAIAVTCTHCGVKLRFKGEHAGKTTKCRACEKPIIVQGETIPDHDVFVSYSSKDVNVANAVCAALEAKKMRCWIAPRDVLPGKAWAGAILDAISDARVMVLVYSANANASPQVIREVDCAVTRNVVIIPFRIEAATMTKEMQYYIAAAHWLDAMDGSMEEHIARLVTSVRSLLAASNPAPMKVGSKPASPKGKSDPRRIRMILATAVMVLVLAMIGVWFAMSRRHPPSPIAGGPAPQTSPTAAKGDVTTRPVIAQLTSVAPRTPVAVKSAPAPSAPTSLPAGAIDLIAKVRLPDDAVAGVWTKDAKGLHAERTRVGEEMALRLAVGPLGEYDFSITFVRENSSVLRQVLSYKGTGFAWIIGARNICGFNVVDHASFPNHDTVRMNPALSNGEKHTSLVRVRKNSVSAYLDGNPISEIRTDYSNLSIDPSESVGEGFLGIKGRGPIDILSAEVIPCAPASDAVTESAPTSPGPGGHLWVQCSFPDDQHSGVQVFVNGVLLGSSPHDQAFRPRDFAVDLHAGDVIAVRASTTFANRYVRFAYLDHDHKPLFAGTPTNTMVRRVDNISAPAPTDPTIGDAPAPAAIHRDKARNGKATACRTMLSQSACRKGITSTISFSKFHSRTSNHPDLPLDGALLRIRCCPTCPKRSFATRFMTSSPFGWSDRSTRCCFVCSTRSRCSASAAFASLAWRRWRIRGQIIRDTATAWV